MSNVIKVNLQFSVYYAIFPLEIGGGGRAGGGGGNVLLILVRERV